MTLGRCPLSIFCSRGDLARLGARVVAASAHSKAFFFSSSLLLSSDTQVYELKYEPASEPLHISAERGREDQARLGFRFQGVSGKRGFGGWGRHHAPCTVKSWVRGEG